MEKYNQYILLNFSLCFPQTKESHKQQWVIFEFTQKDITVYSFLLFVENKRRSLVERPGCTFPFP